MRTSHTTLKGFSLIETLTTVAIIGVLAAVGFQYFGQAAKPARAMAMESNVATLNRAVTAYLASGGDLSDETTPAEVLANLKTVAAESDLVAGYSGSFVDARLELVPLSAEEASSTQPRVAWNSSEHRFYITDSGTDSVAGFRLNDDLATVALGQETREAPLQLASASPWVWDYTESSVAANAAVAPIPTAEVGEPAPPADPNPSAPLQPPTFSHPSSTLPIEDFPLALELTNPNGAGLLMYSIDGSPWSNYSAPLLVAPNQAIAAYVASAGSEYYSSPVASRTYQANAQQFSGAANGNFVDPTGEDDMVTRTDDGLFEWGSPVTEDGYSSGSVLQFHGAAFENIQPAQMFRLGTLDYYNSTIWLASAAWNVTLALDLALASPAINTQFSFGLELINTANRNDQTANENADFVRLTNPSAQFSTLLNGNLYALELAFGYLGQDGFASVDQFHVHEGANATADLWGRFVLEEAFLGDDSTTN